MNAWWAFKQFAHKDCARRHSSGAARGPPCARLCARWGEPKTSYGHAQVSYAGHGHAQSEFLCAHVLAGAHFKRTGNSLGHARDSSERAAARNVRAGTHFERAR